ncbi:unnamed protein product [Prunus armeniaca]
MSCKFGPDRTVGSLTITRSDGPSNGPNPANPENTRYAISVRDSNNIQIEIRAHLRAHDNLRITLGQKCPSATVPTRRHTRRQRVGVQSDNPSPEKPQITAQDSYPRRTPKTDRKWPESPLEIRPKSNSKIRPPTLKIDAILPNHQLDHAEGMNFHTLIAKNGGRTTENEVGEVSVKTGAFSGEITAAGDGTWPG